MDGCKSLLDLTVVVDRNKLLDVNLFKGAQGGISDHHLVVAKVRCLRRWPGRVVRVEERYEIKVRELRKMTCKTEYKEKLKQRWERARGELEGGRR